MHLTSYVTVMFAAIDAVDIDRQPERDSNMVAALYFVAFIVVCGFILLNLFIGVIFSQFSKMRLYNNVAGAILSKRQVKRCQSKRERKRA